jgi:uncharacterized protein (TIRG00374 family)
MRTGVLKRSFVVLRLVVAGAILYWVARTLPWKDELSYRLDDGAVLSSDGVIEGEWKESQADFMFLPGSRLESGWPEEALQAAHEDEVLHVQRRGAAGRGYDWQPGMPRVFGAMDSGLLALALILLLSGNLTIVTRWWRLLALAGCPTTWFNALRLTFIGLFFNAVMPGQTGGDLVKGILAAKENPERRADALVSVLADRIFGMLALAILAVTVILAAGGPFLVLRQGLLGLLLTVVLGLGLYANKSFRKKIGLSALVDRLPIGEKLRKLDEAALLYLRHPAQVAIAFGFSFLNHFCVVLGVYFLGRALGVPLKQVGLLEYLVLVPVANIVAAIPLAPGGWGLGELIYSKLFQLIGASAALGVAVSVTFRLSMLLMGLLGSPFLLLPGNRAAIREAEGTPET